MLNTLSRFLFRAARLTRDAKAISRGPGAAFLRFAVRKPAGRGFGRIMRKLVP
jgi:hypothetical protein